MDIAQPGRWSRIQTIFEQALELDADARASFVESTCSTDPVLQREVERLLAAHEASVGFLAAIDSEKSAALLNASSADATTPDTIGRYRIVRRLGSGAMGVVYLAHDPQLDRRVALKLLRARHSVSRAAQQRLLEEARAASALDHPNVAAIHEIGETADGRQFIAMAYCEGESLADRIARGPLDVRDAVHIAQQIAEALAAAHALGVVHRDVKPANIIISADGRARLMDFGVANVVGRGGHDRLMIAGTPAYMSPEQIGGANSAPAADVWAFGVVLYEMLTGERPFRGDSGEALHAAILQGTPVGIRQIRAQVPGDVAGIAERCLSKDPADRPTDIRHVATKLRSCLSIAGGVQKWRRLQLVVAVSALTLLVVGLFARNASDTEAVADAKLVVLPFTPVVMDSLLERMGRELVVTLSASLDGVGGLRVVEPITVLVQDAHAALTARVDLARRLGATAILDGRLSRAGAAVRLDATVHAARDLAVMARASATAPLDDIGALTDSVTVALLRTTWRGRSGPAPNLAAITTNSLPALRAYLEGELAIADGRFRAAPVAFARAIQADSTFWFAYWRYMYVQNYHGNPVDSLIRAKVIEHRSSFPEPDRLLVEARLLPGQRAQLEARRAITMRNPTYWPALFELGDQLSHHGPFIGEPTEEARTALRRTTEMNPNFVPAWEHRLWLAVLAMDTAETARAVARLTAMRLDSLSRDEWDHRLLDYYQYLDHLSRSGGTPHAGFTDIGVRVLSRSAGPVDPERNATTLTNYGFHRAQLELSRGVLSQRPRTRVAAAHIWGIALAWAGRGGWDSAFAAARQYGRSTTHPNGAMWAFGLATAGAWLGGLHADSAATLRAAALRSESGRSIDGAAEIAWLDGLLACTHGNRAELNRQHQILRRSSVSGAATLAASLSAFETAFTDRNKAAHKLAALERANADQAWQFQHGARHPFLVGVNRLAAGRLLLATGDTADAVSLLLMHEVDLPQRLHPFPTVSFILGTYALPGLARVADASGRAEQARQYRYIFRGRVDFANQPDVLAGTAICGAPADAPG